MNSFNYVRSYRVLPLLCYTVLAFRGFDIKCESFTIVLKKDEIKANLYAYETCTILELYLCNEASGIAQDRKLRVVYKTRVNTFPIRIDQNRKITFFLIR